MCWNLSWRNRGTKEFQHSLRQNQTVDLMVNPVPSQSFYNLSSVLIDYSTFQLRHPFITTNSWCLSRARKYENTNQRTELNLSIKNTLCLTSLFLGLLKNIQSTTKRNNFFIMKFISTNVRAVNFNRHKGVVLLITESKRILQRRIN